MKDRRPRDRRMTAKQAKRAVVTPDMKDAMTPWTQSLDPDHHLRHPADELQREVRRHRKGR